MVLLAGTVLEAEGLRIAAGGPAVHLDITPLGAEIVAEGAGHLTIQGLAEPVDLDLSGDRVSLSLARPA